MDFEEKKLKKKKEKALDEDKKELVAEACNNLGDFYNQTGRYMEAANEYEEEALTYKKLGTKYVLKMAKAHRMVGEMFMLLSEFGSALKNINIYLKYARSLNSKIEEQRAYATLGRAYLLNGQSDLDASAASNQLKQAEKAFIKSLLIVKELTGQISKLELLDMQARLYLNIGVVKEHMGEFEEAINYKEKAIKICKDNDIFELLHVCYISLSLLYLVKKNNSSVALRICNLALEVAERLSEKTKKICETLLTKSEILIKEGDFQSAKKVLFKAYKLKTPDLNDKQNIEKTLKIVAALCYTLNSLTKTSLDNYNNRKRLYEKMGDGSCILQNYNKAIEYYLQTLECAQKNGDSKKQLVPIYVSLYQTYKDNKDYEKSLEYLWKEHEANIDLPVEVVNTFCNIAEICELQNKSFWTIYEIYQNALKETTKIEDSSKLRKIVFTREYKLAMKYNMNTIADDIREESLKENIDVEKLSHEDDTDSDDINVEESTPDIGDEIYLDDLTDSNSETEESDKQRSVRKRGNTCLAIKRNNKGETQLHQACIAGNINLARRLIGQGHPINVRDHAGWLPLHEACNHGFSEIVELLLDNGGVSAINDKGGTSCDGITPLYDACSNGYLDVIELLLERGANPTLKTDFGDTSINILDKWRISVHLDCNEQSQYERIRSKIVYQFSKIGEKIHSSPLENSTESNKNTLEPLNELTCNESDSETRNHRDSDGRDKFSKNITIDDIDDICSSQSRNVTRQNISEKKHYENKNSAKNEYKNVMENLKHPLRSVSNMGDHRQIEKKKKRAGFLREDEVDDDWLDDDMCPRKKRHKSLIDSKMYSTDPSSSKQASKNLKNTTEYCTVPNPQKINLYSDSSDSDDSNKVNAFSLLCKPKNKRTNEKHKSRRRSSISSCSSDKSDKTKHQSSLLDNGFRRNFSTSHDQIKEIEPDSTTIIIESPKKRIDQTEIKISPQKMNPTISFRIKVENELLLVPVERKRTNELNIKWLAEEASRRYYNLIGLKPNLRLMTADGFNFEETDPINVAMEENMIASKLLDWEISPLGERYQEMCYQINQVPDETTKLTLEKAQASSDLTLTDWALTPNLTEPIFKAILNQSTLRILDLSNNFIQNEGCKQLGKSLFTLRQLKILNLKGNFITSDGLKHLINSQSTFNNDNSDLPELETINLSFNPLGDASLKYLEKLCKISKKLKTLYLQSCFLEEISEFDLNYENLIDFDISFNKLSVNSSNKILHNLNACQIINIAMNYTNTKNPEFGFKFYEFLTKGTCDKLKEIQIANCSLQDSHVYRIVKLLAKNESLKSINFSNNNKLTGASLQFIIENLSHVRKIFLEECENIVEISNLQNINFNGIMKYPEILTISLSNSNDSEIILKQNDILKWFWNKCHGSKGKIYCKGNYNCLYVNDEDLNSIKFHKM